MTNKTPRYHLYIADISVDFSGWDEDVHSAEARIDNLPVKAAWKRHVGKTLSQIFVPPMKLSIQDSFSLHLVYNGNDKPDGVHFNMNHIFQAYGAQAALGGPEKQKYHTPHRKIHIVLNLSKNSRTNGKSDLVPTIDDISVICPRLRFRILLIGKAGVGKASLIEHVFGVNNALVSNLKRGEANIDTEFISPQNNRFVLHHSGGFEPGDGGNVDIVRQFIERRGKMPDLGERLHAIWLCIQIPSTGGRVLETGTEDFLKLKCSGQLGNGVLISNYLAVQVNLPLVKVPVIVVFTQYDKLINQVDFELGSSGDGLSNDTIKELIMNRAEAKLRESCIGPLERFVASIGSDIPHATVSTSDNHKESLVHLIQITADHVNKHVAVDIPVMASVARWMNHGFKVKASIDVGKRQYGKVLTGVFKNRSAGIDLHALHTDIVTVWDFNDPHHYLSSQGFRILVVGTVDKLDVGPPTTNGPSNTIKVGISMVGAIAGISPAPNHLQRFISYIVDLTIILQTLCLVLDWDDGLSIRAIKLAVAAYHRSSVSGSVHARVQEYVRKSTFLDRADRDILDEVIELVNSYSIPTSEISFLRQQISAVDSTEEPW
ncbi:hypothetical protein M405DRAFT_934775 [Rhizopogon salebrosus TDB-379]|nr:hypothetical protein M405DRAFT_934775 [Rhizopogon salebrosus TDB-379]